MLNHAPPYLCENCEEYKDTRCVKKGYTREYMVYGRSHLDIYLREIDPISPPSDNTRIGGESADSPKSDKSDFANPQDVNRKGA